MREHPPEFSDRQSGFAGPLLSRIDAVCVLLDQGKYWKASEVLQGKRWLDGLELSGVQDGRLRRAQQWVDAAHDTLRSAEVDVHLAERILLEARRALAS